MKWGIALACLTAIAFVAAEVDAATMQGPDATSSLLKAGRNYQTLGNLEVLNRRSSVTYGDAIKAFGRASFCRLVGSPTVAVATWRGLGIRLRLATLGGMPRGRTGCSSPRLIHIDSAYVTGMRWQTQSGLRVGATVEELRALYPRAIFQRRRIGNWPVPAWWIVHVRQRCVIGICRSPYETAARLTAHIRNGHVAGFFFPVGAQGE